MIRCQHCNALIQTPGAQDEVVASLLAAKRSVGFGSNDDLAGIGHLEGPAAGIYECLNCKAVNEVVRLIGGNWDVVLNSLPQEPERIDEVKE